MTALPQPDQYDSFAPKQNFDFGLPSAARSAPSREVRQFSLASSVRLQTIVENAPQIPEKSALRNSIGQASIVTMLMQHQEHQQQQQHMLKLASAPGSPHLVPRAPRASSDSASTRTVQPAAYSWMPDVRAMSSYGNASSNSGSISGSSMQNEKLAESLRQMHDETRQSRNQNRRKKVRFIGILVLGGLLIVGLAVGLGVGLTSAMNRSRRQPDHAADAAGAKSPSSSLDGNSQEKFPLGHYRIVTSLKHRDTACTSDPASWTCYADAGSDASSLVMFDWVISATAPMFATSVTGTTAESGIPANLSISSSAITGTDPFGGNMVFSNKSLTYISPTANDALSSSSPLTTNLTMAVATGPRYIFNFVMPELSSVNVVNSNIPTTVKPLTTRDGADPPSNSTAASSNSTSQCLNMTTTTLTAILYLSQPNTLASPSKAARDSSSPLPNSAPTWPYAVEILQSRDSGGSGPCHADVSARDAGHDTNGRCSCSWRNF
jgi:hypothetical protein